MHWTSSFSSFVQQTPKGIRAKVQQDGETLLDIKKPLSPDTFKKKVQLTMQKLAKTRKNGGRQRKRLTLRRRRRR
jgi:hypothetical protein